MSFDGLDYTRNALLEEVSLIERHARDGSAVTAGCACIEEKHLLTLAGLASEGVTLAVDQAEKEYYLRLADWARNTRKEIIEGKFKAAGNPGSRAYLPHGLTECEKTHANVRKKLARCIKKNEPREEAGEIESAVAVCRASVPCP